MIAQLKYLLQKEYEYVVEERKQKKFCLRWSRLVLLILVILYVPSPVDLLPELGNKTVWLAYVDDILIAFLGLGIVFADVTAALQCSAGLFQNIKLPSLSFENDEPAPVVKDEEEEDEDLDGEIEIIDEDEEVVEEPDEDLKQYAEEETAT